MKVLLGVLAALAFAVVGASRSGSSPDALAGASQGPLPRMTLAQAAGQRMVFAYDGLTPPKALEKRIARGEAAGVILFARNVRSVPQVRRTIARLQAIRRPAGLDAPLLVMVDQEGGPVRRLPGAPRRGAAQMHTTVIAQNSGIAAGKLLKGAGVNVDLAPVVDVGRRGSALRDEGRVFSGDPQTVTERGRAFARGLQIAGVEPVLKHFPGFGAATVNTDDAPARIRLPLGTLRAVDGRPYAGIRSNIIMMSTAVYPAVDPRPAAFARRWVTEELRGRHRFRGVVITDDLQAAAVKPFGSVAQLAYFAVSAGVDLPLFAQSYTAGARAAHGLEQAVKEGALTRAGLEVGAQRVLALRIGMRR